jgi:glycosyltransferase involved in cell wall biosynthesis
MQGTPLWPTWDVRHVATHRRGSLATKARAFATGLGRFLAELVVRRPALVHVHTSSHGSFARKSALTWLSRAAGVPVVLHVHSGAFGDFHAGAPPVVQRYIRRTLTAADRVVALDASWAGVLQRIAPDAHVVVVPNGVTPRALVPQAGPGEPVRVLFVGAVTEAKGAFVLLDAWRDVVTRTPTADLQLVLAGAGDLDRARSRLEDLDLAGRVRLAGWVDPSGVAHLMSTSHVLVLPSRAEGQPMAVLEGMAHGLCVVGTAVGGIPGLLTGECGLLVPPDDVGALAEALHRVVTDPALRSRLGARAWARVRERYDLDLTWRQLDRLYAEVLR